MRAASRRTRPTRRWQLVELFSTTSLLRPRLTDSDTQWLSWLVRNGKHIDGHGLVDGDALWDADYIS